MNPMVDSLRAVPLFADLRPKDLKRLADSMKERRFAAGDEIVAQGKGGVGFFVILDGSASVTQDGEVRATFGPGDYFGEMALIDGELRLATVQADGRAALRLDDHLELPALRARSPGRGVGADDGAGQARARRAGRGAPGADGRLTDFTNLADPRR